MSKSKRIDANASGVAALSICESLLLALGDHKVMNEREIIAVVADAADAHRFARGSPDDSKLHLEVAAILDRIIAGGNSVRHR